MPNLDKQGPPNGDGPMSGGQRGKCKDSDPKERPMDGRGKGMGRGRGRGRGKGMGRGMGRRRDVEEKDKTIEAQLSSRRLIK